MSNQIAEAENIQRKILHMMELSKVLHVPFSVFTTYSNSSQESVSFGVVWLYFSFSSEVEMILAE